MIDHHELRALLDTLHVVETVALLPKADSTNRIGRRVIDECLENELVIAPALIIAQEQTAGRGRGANKWFSPGGGIYATLLQTRKRDDITVLPLEVAVAVAHYLRTAYQIEAGIKWPNDIVVSGRKIAGILIEARSSPDDVYLTIGIGVNVKPLQGSQLSASSICEAAARNVPLDDATVEFIRSIDRSLFAAPSPDQTVAQWREWSVHREGDAITARIGNVSISGTWLGIDATGHARLRKEDGSVASIASGEIVQHSS